MKIPQLLPALAAVALLLLAGCSGKEETPDDNKGTEYDEQYYASHASISSDDSAFTSTSEGGNVVFPVEGGSVVINVDCGTDWIAENRATDIYSVSADVKAGTLTITASQNTASAECIGVIVLKTAASGIEFATVTATQEAYEAPDFTLCDETWHAPAKGALTTVIPIDPTVGDYTIEDCDADWLTVAKEDEGVRLTAEENGLTEERTAQVTLAATDGISTVYGSISVIQDAAAFIDLGAETLSFSCGGETVTVSVSSNYDLTWDCAESWITVEVDDKGIAVTASYNSLDEPREGTITLTAGDGAENTASTALSVTQYGFGSMILTYTISSSGTEVILPIRGTVDCTVDWGDGSSEHATTNHPTHTYASTGSFNVIITGTATNLNSYDFASSKSPNTTLTAVVQWGNTGLTLMENAFFCNSALRSVPSNTTDSFAQVTSFKAVFEECFYLTSIPDGMFGNCPNATTFAKAFWQCYNLTTIPSGLFSQCPEVTDFSYLFYDCTSLRAITSDMFAGCSKATNFSNAFYLCPVIAEIPAGLFDDCVGVTSITGAFRHCDSVKSVPEGLFDNFSKVEDFSYVFDECHSLTSLPSGLFAKCTEAADFTFIFGACYALQTLPSGLFSGCSKAATFFRAFCYCEGLLSIPKGLFDDCTEVTDFSWAFNECIALTEISEGLFDHCTKATNFDHLFNDCIALQSIPKGLFDNCSEAEDFSNVFSICCALKEIPAGLFDSCTKATSFYQAFYYCTSLKEIPANLFSKCASATDFTYAFCWCAALEKVNSGVFSGCSAATTFYETFYYDPLLTTVAGDIFDGCSSAEDMSYVFAYCYALDNLPGTVFDGCTEATNFYRAFYSCFGMTGLPASLFDCNTKVKNFTETFAGCTALTGESPYTEVDGAKVHLYQRSPDYGFTAPISYLDCFDGCTGLSDYGDIPFIWGGDSSTLSVKATSAPQPVRPAGEDPADHGGLPDPRDGGTAMNGSAHSARSTHSI